MAVRPTASVLSLDGKAVGQVKLPAVFSAPIRPDIIQLVHTNVAKNSRQAYAVSAKAGHQTAAESWGTGRAVSRIPRVPGGGTHRAGQAAFGNMCRGGHMYAPTKVWRRWHRKVNINIKRYAVASALAASSVTSLVLARGHRVESIPEVPLVLEDKAQEITKTSAAVKVLKAIGATADVERAAESRQIRKGKGKMRNRRYVSRKGPLVVYGEDNGIAKAFRNIPGVDVASVERLNLLKLAPGGHLGRFLIWTKSAVEKLDSIFGTQDKASLVKKGFTLPRSAMSNADLARLINSDEIQTIVKVPKTAHKVKHAPLKRNPLRNKDALEKLNPYAKAARAAALKLKRTAFKATAQTKAAKKAFAKGLRVESQYEGEDFSGFSNWLGAN